MAILFGKVEPHEHAHPHFDDRGVPGDWGGDGRGALDLEGYEQGDGYGYDERTDKHAHDVRYGYPTVVWTLMY